MAGAEARAVWQRAANRCFVQEDAKRAPKLACYPSTPSSKQTNTPYVNDDFAPLNDKSSYSNLSDSRWWLRLQPDYIQQWGLNNEKVNTFDNEDGSRNSFDSMNSRSRESYEFVEMDSFDCSNGFKEGNEFGLGSKVHPWWRMSEKEDLGSFVSNKSHGNIEHENAISRVEVQHVRGKQFSPRSQREMAVPEILEALRHSQTRAREAENAAKEAYTEKEHVVKLLFKQASQLFAYKQWLYVLQLENLYYQIKNNQKPAKPKTNPRPAKRKPQSRHGVGRYAVVFVVGLGFVSAGLLLGWTVGWMLI